jgi:hypothetical protein
MMFKKSILAFVVLGLVLSNCSTQSSSGPVAPSAVQPSVAPSAVQPSVAPSAVQPSCGQQNSEYVAIIKDIVTRWDKKNQEAQSVRSNLYLVTSRAGELLEIREETSAIEPPECAKNTHEVLMLYMDLELIGYLYLGTGKDKQEVDEAFEIAQEGRGILEQSWQELMD